MGPKRQQVTPINLNLQLVTNDQFVCRVFVVGEWNDWDVVSDPLNKESNSEYWQAFVPEARPEQKYKYLISYYGLYISFICTMNFRRLTAAQRERPLEMYTGMIQGEKY